MQEIKKDVRQFLRKDFWHYINLGGISYSQLSSPRLDETKTNPTNTNGTEKSLLNAMDDAERNKYIAITILIAFKDCTDIEGQRHKSILENYFIKKLDNQAVAIRVNLTESQYKRQKRKALYEFIERFSYWRKKRGCNELPILIYVKKNKKPTKRDLVPS